MWVLNLGRDWDGVGFSKPLTLSHLPPMIAPCFYPELPSPPGGTLRGHSAPTGYTGSPLPSPIPVPALLRLPSPSRWDELSSEAPCLPQPQIYAGLPGCPPVPLPDFYSGSPWLVSLQREEEDTLGCCL